MPKAFGSVFCYSRNRLGLAEKAFIKQTQDYAVCAAAGSARSWLRSRLFRHLLLRRLFLFLRVALGGSFSFAIYWWAAWEGELAR